ncbi:MAG: YhcH/YjgK/YiaL family protein [Clostridia bacterium]
MIYDTLINIPIYGNISERLEKAFRYLADHDMEFFDDGRYEIDGQEIFCIIQSYSSKEESAWEGHKEYIDIQYMIYGTEEIRVSNIEEMRHVGMYDPEKDIHFFEGAASCRLFMRPRDFAVFFPEDIHMPALCIDAPSHVKKAVIKVHV